MTTYSYVDRDRKIMVNEYAVKVSKRVNRVVSIFSFPTKINTPSRNKKCK